MLEVKLPFLSLNVMKSYEFLNYKKDSGNAEPLKMYEVQSLLMNNVNQLYDNCLLTESYHLSSMKLRFVKLENREIGRLFCKILLTELLYTRTFLITTLTRSKFSDEEGSYCTAYN